MARHQQRRSHVPAAAAASSSIGRAIVDVVDGTATDLTGVVEFRATYMTAPGDVRVLHERSRFVRDGGHWYYLDADAQQANY